MNLHREFVRISHDGAMQLARETLIATLTRKFEDAGFAPDPIQIAAFIDHGLSRAKGDFQWDTDSEDLAAFVDALEMDDAEWDLLHAEQADFLKQAGKVMRETAERSGAELFETLKVGWPEIQAGNKAHNDGFKQRLEARWGEAFGYVRMLLHMSMEHGGEHLARLRRSRAKKPKVRRHLLQRLYTRACQVTGEILALMEAGFADGAMARWRTLHEITVVAIIIADGDEDLAERYVAHEHVSKHQEAVLHQENCADRFETPYTDAEMAALKAERDAVVQRYGPAFKKSEGWAAAYLGNPDPKFSHLEAAAGRTSARPDYKLASYNVHAGSRGLFFKLGTIDGSGFMLGASDTGFSDPGIATVDALIHVNATLMANPPSLDELIILLTLAHTRDAAREAFERAAAKLLDDHAQIQANGGKKRSPRTRRR